MKTEEIINKYKRIYVGIFKYLVYVLILVFGIIISINQIKKYKQLDQSNDFIVEKAKLKGRFDKIYNIDGGEDTKIHIIQGEFENTGNLLFSTNNLVSYKGITLPKNIFLYKDIDIKNLNHFESGNYQIQEIEKIGNNIVFNSADQIENTKNNFFSLPLTENSIYQTFYLKGLHQPINIKKINQHYVSSFLENFYIYDISKDYKGLSEIFYQINKTNYKPQFCDNVLKYLNYSQDTNKEIESILTQCGDSYILYFDKFKSFLEIQDQVNKGYINEKIYTDTILNNYK
ncbi:MAG TPA: hypothetical protein P5060_02880, partial [Candidatus Absconditabacterales bacterium]|nr:hypothetical protein [Candidatus Absconditabacterales bacterium]